MSRLLRRRRVDWFHRRQSERATCIDSAAHATTEDGENIREKPSLYIASLARSDDDGTSQPVVIEADDSYSQIFGMTALRLQQECNGTID